MIHLFFPSLYSESRTSRAYLTSKERKEFYEQGLRPAIESLVPLDRNDWPATYEGELFRARKQSGAMAFQTKMLQRFAVPHLIDHIRQSLSENGIDWAQDCLVMHTVRGTKNGTKHSLTEDAASLSLDEFLHSVHLSSAAIEQGGEWYIDVGVEFASSLDHCLQWTTTSHFHVVKEVLQISDHHASRITTLGSSKYQRDIASHLPALSGCRIEPGTHATGPFDAVYYQQYTNEKSLTYNPEKGHHGKAITIKEAMGKTQPAPFIENLYELYFKARDSNSSHARVEVRVPFVFATTVLLTIHPDIVEQSLLSFPRQTWW
jgi:hypothetical protein